MKIRATHPRHKEVGYSGNGASCRKRTSAFDLYGVLIAWGWLDGGGKSDRWTHRGALGRQSFTLASTQARRDAQKRRSGSFGSISMITAGAPIRLGGASPLRVATGGDASFEARKLPPPLTPPGRIRGARAILGSLSRPSPSGLRLRGVKQRSKLDSYRTPFYD
jgi:hypothetical protein